MRSPLRLAALGLLLVGSLDPGMARAGNDEHGLALPMRLHYLALGGIMAPVGPQGRPLSRGPYAGVAVLGESAIGMQLGGEASFVASGDVLRTHFTSLGVIARMSPTPDDYRVYVQLGVGLYEVTYSPKVAGVSAPGTTVRPGGSFGIGLEVFQTTHVSVGGLLCYHGVVLASRTARSYMIAGLSLTLRPSDY